MYSEGRWLILFVHRGSGYLVFHVAYVGGEGPPFSPHVRRLSLCVLCQPPWSEGPICGAVGRRDQVGFVWKALCGLCIILLGIQVSAGSGGPGRSPACAPI